MAFRRHAKPVRPAFSTAPYGACRPPVSGRLNAQHLHGWGRPVAGDHDVLFLGPQERVILSHRAESRAIFARGALAGAHFLIGKPAGLYSMRDVIDSR